MRVIPDALGIEVDASAWTLPPVFEWLQREGAVADAEMWRTFNCGLGFVLAVDASAATQVEAGLAQHGLDNWRIGQVSDDAGDRVRIG